MGTMIAAILTLSMSIVSPDTDSKQPVYVRPVADTAQLRKSCDKFMAMSEDDLLKLVPPQGGFFYSGSPATTQGAQENNLGWDLSLGDKIKCIFSGTLLPNKDYPENGHVDVKTPTGKIQRFHYYQDPKGKKYWFEARRWFDQRGLMEGAASSLALLYSADPRRYREQGRRAALIMKRFAEVYPDYMVKYDYPGYDKKLLSEAEHKKAGKTINHYFIELTKWSYWGYHELSSTLVLAYDQLKGADFLSVGDRKQIEGLFDGMIAYTDPFEEVPIGNMHPYMWITKAIAANVLNKPELLKTVFKGVDRLIAEQFTYDGMYMEVTVSYHAQTVNGLKSLLTWAFPGIGKEALTEKIRTEYPALFRAMQANLAYRLPDGRYASVNDTHWTDLQPEPITRSAPQLMPAAGHAVLGSGAADQQMQAHLGYSGWHGHNHYGSLGLIFFANGKELISDIGYTHTRARTWTMTTAAHNTVVIDGKSQRKNKNPRAGLGDLLIYNAEHPNFQVVEVKADEVYDHPADYRRTLITVRGENQPGYLVDLFHVAGGSRHDWILHGSSDEDQTLEVTGHTGQKLPFAPLATLVPPHVSYQELREQGSYELIWRDYWAYGHFKQIKAAPVSAPLKATFRFTSNPELGHQTWIPLETDHTVHTVKSWSVRRANEDQGILDDYLREGMILRADRGKSRFVAVHLPFAKTPAVTSVRQLSDKDSVLILKIDHSGGRDYLLYKSAQSDRTTEIEGQKITLKGKVTLVQATASGSRIMSIEKQKAPLAGFGSHSLTAEGRLQAKAGQTAIVRHADGHTTAFHIESVSHQDGKTTLTTREPVPFEGSYNGKLTMTAFPYMHLPGPHAITVDNASEKLVGKSGKSQSTSKKGR
jgi:hypothetical protein